MQDRLAMQFVQKFTGKTEPPRAQLSQQEQLQQFKRLNLTGWRSIIKRYGVDAARDYHDRMTELSNTLGV